MEGLRPAYFVFLLETSQTAMTGVDVYYWFMAGFGDLNRLKKSILGAIDIPTIDAFISLVVQGFYCYRIWTLHKQSWWLSLIIAIVRICPCVAAMLTYHCSNIPSLLYHKRLEQHGVGSRRVSLLFYTKVISKTDLTCRQLYLKAILLSSPLNMYAFPVILGHPHAALLTPFGTSYG
jgi:hypothetical protein